MVSFGSVLSGMLAVVLLSIYGYLFITHIKHPVYRDMRFLVILLLIAGLRMLVPINLPFNITIPSSELLVPASNIVYTYVVEDKIYLYHVVILIVSIISLILLVKKAICYHNFLSEVKSFTYQNDTLDKLLSERPLNRHNKRISAFYTKANTSPFVYGVLKPTIIVPDDVFKEEEIKQILDHELTHINQNDLWLKAAFNVLTALFWWNPFIWLIRKQAGAAIELSNDISLYNKMDEQEKTDYASLLVKTASLSPHYDAIHSLSLSTHNDPLLKKRVTDLLYEPKNRYTILPIHVCIMVLIIVTSFIVTPEPYEIYEKDIDGSYDYEEDFDATAENSYIIDKGNVYDLYFNGHYVGEIYEIPDEFKDYPVYKEKPEEKSNE